MMLLITVDAERGEATIDLTNELCLDADTASALARLLVAARASGRSVVVECHPLAARQLEIMGWTSKE